MLQLPADRTCLKKLPNAKKHWTAAGETRPGPVFKHPRSSVSQPSTGGPNIGIRGCLESHPREVEETDAHDNLEEAYLVEFPSPPITEFLGCDFKLIPQIYPEMRRMVVEFREPDCEDGDEEGSNLEINEDKEEYLLLESNVPADLGEAEMTQMAEQSEHGEQQSRNAESMETVQIDSVGKVKNLGPKLEAKSVRGHGGTI